MTDCYGRIISLDWERALFAYDFGQPGFVELELTGPDGGKRMVRSGEAMGLGRLALDDLLPDTSYMLKACCGGRSLELNFHTFSAPRGRKLGELILIADPHISESPENRKGRFFVESELILADVAAQCNAFEPDAVLGAGDLTNHGLPGEYRRAAGILAGITAPQLHVPGNHDIVSENGRGDFKRYFGILPDELALPYGIVLGIDTADTMLSDADAGRLRQALDGSAERIFIVTHYQFYANPLIRGPARAVIANAERHARLLVELAACGRVMIYAGHQNIPAVLNLPGGSAQFNLPQPCQYPCGIIRARVFEDGVRHTFVPITSEVLRQYSRRAGNEAAAFYHEPHWLESCREGTGGNFLWRKK